jgi:transcription factor IIIB 90 kDa subunit
MSFPLQVNVFELGSTYLKLVRKLNIPDIPLIDPSIYISRFAALLEFGDDTQRVAQDAARLASRFERDWMQTGRRPSGICGACLILAARMNNFRRSIAEVVQVVKIADVTLKKRLQEFQATKSGSLTVDEFRKVWLQDEDKPPAMLKNEQKERERIKALAAAAEAAARGEGSEESDDDDESTAQLQKKRKLTSKEMLAEKRLRKRSQETATPMRGSSLAPLTPSRKFLPSPSPFDRGEASMSPGAAFASLQGELNRLDSGAVNGQASGSSPAPTPHSAPTEQDILARLAAVRNAEDGDETELLEEQANGKEQKDDLDFPLVDEAVTGEILDYMAQQKPASLAEELELAEQRRLRELEDRIAAQGDEDDLKGLDEDELDAYLLDDRQVAAKTIIWNKFNHEYMVKLNGELGG